MSRFASASNQPPLAAKLQRYRCVRGDLERPLPRSEQPPVKKLETPSVDALPRQQNPEGLRRCGHHADELCPTAYVPSADGKRLDDRAVLCDDVEAGSGDGRFAADGGFDRISKTSAGFSADLKQEHASVRWLGSLKVKI